VAVQNGVAISFCAGRRATPRHLCRRPRDTLVREVRCGRVFPEQRRQRQTGGDTKAAGAIEERQRARRFVASETEHAFINGVQRDLCIGGRSAAWSFTSAVNCTRSSGIAVGFAALTVTVSLSFGRATSRFA
jgi:hypothetical protein